MKRLTSILLWSVISAAFIGPGTITAASSAGSSYGYALLWALAFSTVACLVLQEASARLTTGSGMNLGQALRRRSEGWRRVLVLGLVFGGIVLGCAAYEAGNILGGVAGAALVLRLPEGLLTTVIVLLAGLLLWVNSPRRVALLLSALVAIMGFAFLLTAFWLEPPLGAIVKGGLLPSLPKDSSLLAIALVGTTVVPYNLFLGSGLARGQGITEMRFGLTVAVILGGVISMGVLVVGAAVDAPFTFARLSDVLAGRLGEWARSLFAIGLFCAGLSSAVTAPLAAAITVRSVARSADEERAEWSPRAWRFRAVWLAVLAIGLVFGLSGVRPVPVIILAQAFNGVLLPVIAAFLLLAVNDRAAMGPLINGPLGNVIMTGVVLVAGYLGVLNVARAVSSACGLGIPSPSRLAGVAGMVLLAVAVPMWRAVRAARTSSTG